MAVKKDNKKKHSTIILDSDYIDLIDELGAGNRSRFVREAITHYKNSLSPFDSVESQSNSDRLDFRENLSSMTEVNIPSVLQGFQRGTVGLLTGESGVGKSMLALNMAMQTIHNNANVLGYPSEERGKTVYFTLEDSGVTLSNRLVKFSKEIALDAEYVHDNFHVYDLTSHSSDIESSEFQSYLLERIKGASLVILDTFSDIHTRNENDASDMNIVFGHLQRLARVSDTAILLLHHTTKTVNDKTGEMNRQQSVVRGSSVIVNKSKFQVRLTPFLEKDFKDFPKLKQFKAKDLVHCIYDGNHSQSTVVVYLRTNDGIMQPALIGELPYGLDNSPVKDDLDEDLGYENEPYDINKEYYPDELCGIPMVELEAQRLKDEAKKAEAEKKAMAENNNEDAVDVSRFFQTVNMEG